MKPSNVHTNVHTRSSAGITANSKTAYLQDKVQQRDVAQLGSAPEWGSGGRRFESGRPDLLQDNDLQDMSSTMTGGLFSP